MSRINKLLSIVLALVMLATTITLPVYAETVYTMSVTDAVVKTSDDAMFGVNTDWSVGGVSPFVVDAENRDFSPTIAMKAASSRSEIPVIRLGEGASQKILWKDMVGPYDARQEYTLWDVTGPIEFGLVEKIKYFQELNPDVEFIITVNMNDTAENAGDLAEFLTGDASSEWGANRIEYGLTKPVAVKMYQLGNENDIIAPTMTAYEYVTKSSAIIAEILTADKDAVFGAIGGTSLYERYNSDGEYNDTWLKAIASGLKNNLDYVTFNWYFDMTPTGEIDQLIDMVNESIFEEIGENDIKICFTEIAGAVYTAADGKQTVPYNLKGVLSTADFYIRSYQNTNIKMANYHALNSSSWQYLWVNSEKESGLTGIGMLHQLLKEYGCGDVISANLTGYERGVDSKHAGVAISPDENKLNLIFVNRNNTELTVNLNLNDNYKIYNELVLKSIAGTPALTDISDATENQIDMYRYIYADGKDAGSCTLPAYSVCAIGLEKSVSSDTAVFSGSFGDSDTLSSYTTVLADGAEDLGIDVTIEGGTLNLDGFGDEETTYENNYIYLPDSVSELENYELSAKVTVEKCDSGYLGIIFGSDAKGALLTEGAGNVTLIDTDGVKQQSYTGGTSEDVVTYTQTNAPTLEESASFAVKLVVKDGAVSFFVDGAEVYTDKSAITAGNIGLLFSDISVKIDDLSVTAPKNTTSLKKNFVYEENFNNVENGKLPENFELTSGTVRAYVEDGALIVNNPQWYTYDGVILSDLKNAVVDGLTIEADMTVLGYDASARKSNVKNGGGFMHGIVGSEKSVSAMYAYEPKLVMRKIDGKAALSQELTYQNGETAFENGGTVSLKLVYTDTKTPNIFINGTKISSNLTECISNSKGFVGLFATAAKIKFDNLKISSKQVYEFDAEEVEQKEEKFTYSENFDGMTYGSLPEGWIFARDTTDATSATKAEVRDDALFLYAKETDTHSAYVLFDYAKVLRPGLTMECDITKVKDPLGNTDNSYVGLMYAVDYNAETNTVENASYVAPYTTKDSVAIRDFQTNANWRCEQKTYKDAEGNALTFDWANRTKPVHLKIVLNNKTQSPVIYIDGVELKHTRIYSDDADRILDGMIGLFAYNSRVYIDNIVVSGTQVIAAPANTESYEAEFAGSATEFVSIDDAKSNVVVTAVDFYGNKTNITADAEFSTALISDNKYATTVKYDKNADGIYEFEKVLEWTLIGVDEGFYYEENFDTLETGTLPAGWKFVRETPDAESSTKAEVRDGKLFLYAKEINTYSAYVLFDYKNVLRTGYTMECDIIRVKEPIKGNEANSYAGLMYAVDYDEETNTVRNASYVAPYTTSNKIAIRDFETRAMQYHIPRTYKDANGNELDFNWEDNKTIVHVKIALNNETQSPVIYINGVEYAYDRFYGDGDERVLDGMIGFYAYNSRVYIDNVKVYGTRREAAANTENKIEVLNYKAADGKFEAVVRANKTDLGAKKVVAAIYDKGTKNLVKVSELKNWKAEAKDYRASVKVEGIDGFTLNNYDVKIFAWDMNNLIPVCENAGIN